MRGGKDYSHLQQNRAPDQMGFDAEAEAFRMMQESDQAEADAMAEAWSMANGGNDFDPMAEAERMASASSAPAQPPPPPVGVALPPSFQTAPQLLSQPLPPLPMMQTAPQYQQLGSQYQQLGHLGYGMPGGMPGMPPQMHQMQMQQPFGAAAPLQPFSPFPAYPQAMAQPTLAQHQQFIPQPQAMAQPTVAQHQQPIPQARKQAKTPEVNVPEVDDDIHPDVHDLCKQFKIEESIERQLHNAMKKRKDSWPEDLEKLMELLEQAQTPWRTLTKHIKEIDDGSFQGKPKLEPDLKAIAVKFKLDEPTQRRLAEGFYKRSTYSQCNRDDDLDCITKHLEDAPPGKASDMFNLLYDTLRKGMELPVPGWRSHLRSKGSKGKGKDSRDGEKRSPRRNKSRSRSNRRQREPSRGRRR